MAPGSGCGLATEPPERSPSCARTILSFSLSLGPRHLSLSLNDSPVHGHILATLQDREQREGTLSESRRKTRRWSSVELFFFLLPQPMGQVLS